MTFWKSNYIHWRENALKSHYFVQVLGTLALGLDISLS